MKRRRKNKDSFKPTRRYINQQIENYLSNGGTIRRLEFDEKAYRAFMDSTTGHDEAGSFLRGE